jgi:hypothetical protein
MRAHHSKRGSIIEVVVTARKRAFAHHYSLTHYQA